MTGAREKIFKTNYSAGRVFSWYMGNPRTNFFLFYLIFVIRNEILWLKPKILANTYTNLNLFDRKLPILFLKRNQNSIIFEVHFLNLNFEGQVSKIC